MVYVKNGIKEIDEESAMRAIQLIEYFRAMESRITPEIEVGVLDLRHTELLALLPQSFTTSEAVATGRKIGLSESTVKRFLRKAHVSSSAKRRMDITANSEMSMTL